MIQERGAHYGVGSKVLGSREESQRVVFTGAAAAIERAKADFIARLSPMEDHVCNEDTSLPATY